MNTQNWLQPQPPRLIAVNLDPTTRRRTTASTRCSSGARRRTPRCRPRATASTRSPRACARSAREACARSTTRALRFLDASPSRCPTTPIVVCDMCIPGYWIAGFHGFHAPARAAVSRSAGARSATRSRPRSAPRSPAPARRSSISGDGGFLFACGELATMAQERHPAHRRDRRRRRLRDAALRPGAARARALRRRSAHARLRGARGELRRCAPRPSTGSTTSSARRSRATSPTPSPSVLVAQAPAARAAADDLAELVPEAKLVRPPSVVCTAGTSQCEWSAMSAGTEPDTSASIAVASVIVRGAAPIRPRFTAERRTRSTGSKTSL